MPPKRKDRGNDGEESSEDCNASPQDVSETFRVLDRGVHKEAKICVVCQRLITWRKKWERCWDEVTTCSDRCKKQRKASAKKSPPILTDEDEHATVSVTALADVQDRHRLQLRTKMCELCGEHVELAYRCKYEKGATKWKFVCRDCWPKASGSSEYLEDLWKTRGTVNADMVSATSQQCLEKEGGPTLLGNVYYVYGGTWKGTTGETKGEIARRKKMVGPQHTSASITGHSHEAMDAGGRPSARSYEG